MYPSQQSQRVLYEAHVRSLLEDASPFRPKDQRFPARLLATLRNGLAAVSERLSVRRGLRLHDPLPK